MNERDDYEFQLENFFPLYPKQQGDLSSINKLKEFSSYKLSALEELPERPGTPTKHQIIIKHLLSGYTRLDALILVHEMGTGKTCSAIQAIEQNLEQSENDLFRRVNGGGPGFNGALILTRGKTLMNNFQEELVYRCTDGKYLATPTKNQIERIGKLSKRLISRFYTFFTYEVFAKTVKAMTQREIIKAFDNKIIVIDEAHNLRTPTPFERSLDEEVERESKLNIYGEIHTFLHLLKNKKVILLTGTPMKDSPEEIAPLMNLVLPLDQQMTTHQMFRQRYFSQEGVLMNRESLKREMRGYISFLKAMNSSVKKVFVGEKIGKLRHFVVFPIEMSSFQSEAYRGAYQKDVSERGIYINSRQASRLVFPDGSYGSVGFSRHVSEIRKGQFKLKPAFTRYLLQGTSGLSRDDRDEVVLANIKQLSAEYEFTLRSILEASRRGENSSVYDDAVRGSGLIVLTLLLELFGFSRNHGKRRTQGRNTYAIFTNETTNVNEIMTLKNLFNSDENMHGSLISVIFGSRVIVEGLTFKNVIRKHLKPHWNDSETSQVIYRDWRLGSHTALLREWERHGGKKPQLHIYKHCVLPNKHNRAAKSIDLEMYEISERKDLEISQVLRCMREIAVDCTLFKQRNEKDSSFDGEKECEYEKCSYTCSDSGSIETNPENDQVIYFFEKRQRMLSLLTMHYQYHFVSTFDEIAQIMREVTPAPTEIETLELLQELVNNNTPIKNIYGYPCYLYENKNVFFLSDHIIPFPTSDDIFLSYYSKYPQLWSRVSSHLSPLYEDKTAWFNEILHGHLNSLIPTMIEEMVTLPEPETHQRLVLLPNTIQQKLLEAAITARILESMGKGDQQRLLDTGWFRSLLLEHYKNYFKIFASSSLKQGQALKKDDFEVAITWFLSVVEERAKERCLFASSLGSGRELVTEWKTCSAKQRKMAEEEKELIKKRFETPLGYYGLWNPRLREFCIRDLTRTGTKPTDKRTIQSGKRCINWTKSELAQLAAVALKIPVDRVHTLTHKQSLKIVQENRLLQNILPPGCDKDTLVRLVYWFGLSRDEICAQLQAWFESRGLLVDDYSCGVQTKRK